MTRTKENARLYNCRIQYTSSRTSNASNQNKQNDDSAAGSGEGGNVLMTSPHKEQVYTIP